MFSRHLIIILGLMFVICDNGFSDNLYNNCFTKGLKEQMIGMQESDRKSVEKGVMMGCKVVVQECKLNPDGQLCQAFKKHFENAEVIVETRNIKKPPMDATDLILEGRWEWLGNSFDAKTDYTELLRTGPSIELFQAGGEYQYIPDDQSYMTKPVIGTWSMDNNIVTIDRPDSGVAAYRVISYQKGMLELQETDIGHYKYLKKLINE